MIAATVSPGRVAGAALRRLGRRAGLRDGQVYTVACGLAVAVVLAAVGLPGVLRGFEPAGIGPVAASEPAVDPADDGGPVREAAGPVTPSLPALAPDPLPVGTPRAGVAPPASTPSATSTPPATSPVAPDATSVFASVDDPSRLDGVAVAPDGTVYVVSRGGEQPAALVAFGPRGDRTGRWAAGEAADLTGVAVGPDATVWVVDATTARVLRLDPAAGKLVAAATVPDLPPCSFLPTGDCTSGPLDAPTDLQGLAVDADGTVYVADRAQGLVWSLRGGTLSPFVSIDDRFPNEGPIGVSVMHDGSLVVAVTGRLASLPPGLAAIVQVPVDGGRAGSPRVIADLGPGEVPGDVVAGATGRIYLTLPSSGVVADIGAEQGDRIDIDPGTVEPGFRSPTGIALRDGALLVTDPSDPVDGSRPGLVFSVTVTDRPAR